MFISFLPRQGLFPPSPLLVFASISAFVWSYDQQRIIMRCVYCNIDSIIKPEKMSHKLFWSINCLIGIWFFISVFILIKKKSKDQPDMKIRGVSLRTVNRIIYFGIGVLLLLIIAILAGVD